VAVANWDDASKAHMRARRDTVWTLERAGVRRDVTLPWATLEQGLISVELGIPSYEIVVQRDGPAAKAGLATGDVVVSIGGVPAKPPLRVMTQLENASVAGPIVVKRGEREISVPLPSGEERKVFIGSLTLKPVASGEVLAWLPEGDGPARDAQLPDGCALLEADGTPVKSASDVQSAVQKAFAEKRAVAIRWRDAAGVEGTTKITPQGFADFGDMNASTVTYVFREPNPIAALGLAADRTVRWAQRIVGTLASVFSGGVGADKLSGPVMISKMTYTQAKSSWGSFFLFLGMISMNLAVLNVLPVPLLDGGQLAVHTIERIRKKPIPEVVLERVMWAGLVLLLGLVVYVTRNDIIHLMRN
jgi:regulator of sigma E protease